MTNSANPLPDFWRGKRVLLTGHTGFKGAWMALWLHRLGAQVTGISLPPSTTPNLFDLASIQKITDNHFCDIRDASKLAELVTSFVLGPAIEKARKVVSDHAIIALTKSGQATLAGLLAKPPKPTEAMKQLMSLPDFPARKA